MKEIDDSTRLLIKVLRLPVVSSSQTLFSSESEVKMGDEVASLLAIFNSFKKSGKSATPILGRRGDC